MRALPQESTVAKNIKLALESGNAMFARRELGIGLYVATETARRKRTSGENYLLTFLERIKNMVGYKKMNELLAIDGKATLMFAIDITGSMAGEINAAKDIVTAISERAENPVNFILSSFGDPIGK